MPTARFYAQNTDGTGVVLRPDVTGPLGVFTELESLPSARKVDLDSETNAATIADYEADRSAYSVVSGVLLKSGNPVAINPDGPTETDRKAIPNRKAQIDAYMELGDLAWPGDLPGTATLAQVITRLNQVSVLVQRTNANTNAGQGTFQILRYIGKKLGFIS